MDDFADKYLRKQKRALREKFSRSQKTAIDERRQNSIDRSHKEILKQTLFDRIMELPEFSKVTFLNYRKELMMTNQMLQLGKNNRDIEKEIENTFEGYVWVARRTEAVDKGICEFCGKKLENPAEKDIQKRRGQCLQWYNLYCCREHELEWNEIRDALEHAYSS